MSLVVRIVPGMQSMLSVGCYLKAPCGGPCTDPTHCSLRWQTAGSSPGLAYIGGSKDELPPFTFILELSPESSQELDKKIQRTPQHGCYLLSH